MVSVEDKKRHEERENLLVPFSGQTIGQIIESINPAAAGPKAEPELRKIKAALWRMHDIGLGR